MNFQDYCKQYKDKLVKIYYEDNILVGYIVKTNSTGLTLQVKKDLYFVLKYKSIISIREVI